MNKKPSVRTELRILDQRRIRDALEYHLAYEGARLVVHVAPMRDGTSDGWRVGASVRSALGEEAVHADEIGSSRAEAFHALAAAWKKNERTHGLAMFDWDAVETLLVSVRALEEHRAF